MLTMRERRVLAENAQREARIIADIAPGPLELSIPGLRSKIIVVSKSDGTRDAIISDKYLTIGEFEEMLTGLTKRGYAYDPKHSWHFDKRGNRDGFIIHDLRLVA